MRNARNINRRCQKKTKTNKSKMSEYNSFAVHQKKNRREKIRDIGAQGSMRERKRTRIKNKFSY